ncbi:MAG: diguanylate cyclase [Spirochaetes bacterium]|nr:diguanylate cyclase [Spirochaetota bacterium]
MDKSKKHSILVVEDDNATIMMLTNSLSPEYTVFAAKTGKNAISAAEKYKPDIILLDVLMPDDVLDGYGILGSLKKSEITKDIPVIFVTGLDSNEDEAKGLSMGAADYIAKPFSADNIKLRIAKQIKMSEQMREAEHLSKTDQLTNLPNRRGLEERLNVEWLSAIREHQPISLLIIDVDKFKNYNDAYGHPQGDMALKALGRCLRNSIKRPRDFAGRWGGEEFLLILPGTNAQGAATFAESLREQVQEMEVPASEEMAQKITISIGVSTADNPPAKDGAPDKGKTEGGTMEGFIAEADKALFIAKKSGRNKICSFSGDSA